MGSGGVAVGCGVAGVGVGTVVATGKCAGVAVEAGVGVEAGVAAVGIVATDGVPAIARAGNLRPSPGGAAAVRLVVATGVGRLQGADGLVRPTR